MSISSLKTLCVDKIIRRPEIYGQTLRQAFSTSQQQEINQLCLKMLSAALLPPSKEEVKSKLFLVHATDILPKDQKIVAGNYLHKKNKFDNSRKTAHFALGGLVQPFGKLGTTVYLHSWETQKFAIATPYESGKLVRIFPADSFSIGDYPLSSESFCVTQEENRDEVAVTGWPKEKIVTFNKGTTLREAVANFIKMKAGWVIQTKPDQGELGLYARLSEGPYRFFDLGCPYFYSSLFDDKIVSFGPVMNSDDQNYAGLFKHFDLKLFLITTECYHFSNSKMLVDIPEKKELEFYLKVVPKILSLKGFIDYISSYLDQASVNEWLSWVYYSLQLMWVDLALRKSCGFYFLIDYKQDYPQNLLHWRESLLQQTLNTPADEKMRLLEEPFLNKKFEEVLEFHKDSPLPLKKVEDILFYGYGEDFQLKLLRNLPREQFDAFLPEMIHIPKIGEDQGTKQSVRLYARLCYLIDKYLLKQQESLLVEIHHALKTIQADLSLPGITDVFHFMRENHSRLFVFLLDLLEKVDATSNLYDLAQRFHRYFEIYRSDAMIEKAYDQVKKPTWTIDDLKKKLQRALNYKRALWRDHLLEDCFSALTFDIERIAAVCKMQSEEVLLFWKFHYPEQWKDLEEWLDSFPRDYAKAIEWKRRLQKAEEFRLKKEREKARFFEGLKMGSQLKLLLG